MLAFNRKRSDKHVDYSLAPRAHVNPGANEQACGVNLKIYTPLLCYLGLHSDVRGNPKEQPG